MRRLETPSMLIYYPEHAKETAHRIAGRLETCATALKKQARIKGGNSKDKLVIVIPDSPLNNAYVSPNAGGNEAHSLLPTHFTFDFTTELGLPSDPSYVGCHEVVHYIQTLQVKGPWHWADGAFGALISPQIGIDAWFAEGLATYYESALQKGTGRMAWPVWRGAFHAGYAGKTIRGGDFSTAQRPYSWGHHYLVGSHFVSFIADRYGEDALWKLVEKQGASWLFPVGVALRWKAATGSSLPSLIGEFSDYVSEKFPKRDRPNSQRVVRSAAESARYVVSSTGREAVLVQDGDTPASLHIYEGGKRIRNVRLTDVVFPRTLVSPSPKTATGLSFTGDGEELYFTMLDPGSVVASSRLVRYRIKDDSLEIVASGLGGPGGGITANAEHYYYSYAANDRHDVAVLELATGERRTIRQAEPQAYYGTVRPSPSGKFLASSVFNGKRHVVQILDANTGLTVDEITPPSAIHDPSWISETSLVMLVEVDKVFQAHVYDTQTKQLTQISEAPYLAFQARGYKGAVRFLNRVDWTYTIDEVALPVSTALTKEAAVLNSDSPIPSSASLSTKVSELETTVADKPVTILSDTSYSQSERLFYPSIRLPFYQSQSGGTRLLGLSLGGRDPLGYHNWSIFGMYDLLGKEWSGGLGYSTGLLAPYSAALRLERYAWNETVKVGNESRAGSFRRQMRVDLSVQRSFRDIDVALGMEAVEDLDKDNSEILLQKRRLAGPRLSLSHTALELTSYGGIRRGIALSGSAGFYSNEFSSFGENIADLGGRLTLWSPMPFGERHGLAASVSGRRLVGVDRKQGFLEVGGGGSIFKSLSGRPKDFEEPDTSVTGVPSQLAFSESLRGFEDLPFLSDRISTAEIVYRYPIILDYGFSSIAYLLPSLFIRQVDFELFGVGATDSFKNFGQHRKLATGGSVQLSTIVGFIPLSFRYQLAQRFSDDDALVHLISIGSN